MCAKSRKRVAFRPSLSFAGLEERVVLNGASAAAAASTMSIPQIRAAFVAELKSAQQDLRQAIASDVAQFRSLRFATDQDVANFRSTIANTVSATESQLSSLLSLLPRADQKLVPNLRTALAGQGANSLTSRLNAAITRFENSSQNSNLSTSLSRLVNTTFASQNSRLTAFFNPSTIRQASVDQTGQRIPLQQYVSNQIVTQLGDSNSALSQAIGSSAGAGLLASASSGLTGMNLTSFFNQSTASLGSALSQVGSTMVLSQNSLGTTNTGTSNTGVGTTINGNGTTTNVNGNGTAVSTTINPTANPNFSNFISGFQGSPQTSDLVTTTMTGFTSAPIPTVNVQFVGAPGITVGGVTTTTTASGGGVVNSGSTGTTGASTSTGLTGTTGAASGTGLTGTTGGMFGPGSTGSTGATVTQTGGAFNPVDVAFNPVDVAFNPVDVAFNPVDVAFNPVGFTIPVVSGFNSTV